MKLCRHGWIVASRCDDDPPNCTQRYHGGIAQTKQNTNHSNLVGMKKYSPNVLPCSARMKLISSVLRNKIQNSIQGVLEDKSRN